MKGMGVVRRCAAAAGRRGASLLFLALLDAAYGYSLLAIPASDQRFFGPLFLPRAAWTAIWMATGCVCAVSAFLRSDRAAFTAAAGLMGIWSALTFWNWLARGQPLGWVGGVIWLAFAVNTLVVSSWPEPLPPLPPLILPEPLPEAP